MSHLNTWLSLERLPLVVYFGSVIAMSTMFCAFHYFKRSVNIEKESVTCQNDRGKRFFKTCSRLFSCCTRHNLKLNNVSKYFVNKSAKSNGTSKETSLNEQRSIAKEESRLGGLAPRRCDDRLSKINNLSVSEEFLEKQQSQSHSTNAEEASFTQIVIAQIEHDNHERNRKAIESQSLDSSRDANGKSSLDKHQNDKLDRGTASAVPHIDATAKNREQEIKCRLSKPLGLVESDKLSEDPIYDVPPSKSLINLNTSNDEEISLQKQHHIQVNNDLAYFHTSSPNIFLNVEQEESIYDTPSTRSLAA